jgi:phosphonate transport system permease protein
MPAAANVSAMTRQASADARLSEFDRHYREHRRVKGLWTTLFGVLFLVALVASIWVSGVNLQRLAVGIPKAWDYVYRTLPKLQFETLFADIAAWYWGIKFWLRLILETILMGFVGTALGAFIALLLCFSASRNLVASKPIHFISRRVLEFFRTVPELVFALIFVYAFGLGPFAGALAIAVHTAGSLGKLFAEVNENVDLRPVEAVRAVGGTWPMIMRLAVVPQALPNYTSYTLLRFEINVRSAGVLGVVGAGGIGEDLYFAIRQFEYADISAIMLLLIAVVAVIDLTCETIRHRLIGQDLHKGA